MGDEERTITRSELEMRIAEATERGYQMGKAQSVKSESVIKLLEGIIELLKG